MNTRLKLCVFYVMAWVVGCGPDFDPYNELKGLRVLAIRAEPPEVRPGEATTLDALIYNDSPQDVSKEWSLCPWPADPNLGFACPVNQKMLDQAWRNATLKGAAPQLAIGTSETADFSFQADTQSARALCRSLAKVVGNAATVLPDCEARWEWTVRLEVAAGERRVATVKAVTLLLSDEQVPNENPGLTGLSAKQSSKLVALDAAQKARLKADAEHELRVLVADGASEDYLPVLVPGQAARKKTREALTFTWFVDAGSTERVRSTYKEGVESLAEASKNDWHAPDTVRSARILVVVRDHRGGVDWREGHVQLVD